ncbi:uncharacterized protein PgNI_04843, partial [Pyricularia grisea]|uniref:Uncharacterized protein n=1 Tax=Pyricularia grisea TaxID=148305 RepID=A0A6P8BE42_PYRGI
MSVTAGNETLSSCQLTAPPGFTYKDPDCKVLCQPTQWTDAISFILVNYLAHAGTIISQPGQSTFKSVFKVVLAFLLPGSGVLQGVNTIWNCAIFGSSNLQTAARAGALCAVVRHDTAAERDIAMYRRTRPEPPSIPTETLYEATLNSYHSSLGAIQNLCRSFQWHQPHRAQVLLKIFLAALAHCVSTVNLLLSFFTDKLPEYLVLLLEHLRRSLLRTEQAVASSQLQPKPLQTRRLFYGWVSLTLIRRHQEVTSMKAIRIHGVCRLPKGYDLMLVPSDAAFINEENQTLIEVSAGYNALKIFISIFQLIYSSHAIYRARGDQIDRYGFAAFGLTVIPYAWMSLVNLTGNLLCPQYNTIFLVGSEGLDHLERVLAAATDDEKKLFPVLGVVGRLHRSTDTQMQKLHRELRICGGEFTILDWGLQYYLVATATTSSQTELTRLSLFTTWLQAM